MVSVRRADPRVRERSAIYVDLAGRQTRFSDHLKHPIDLCPDICGQLRGGARRDFLTWPHAFHTESGSEVGRPSTAEEPKELAKDGIICGCRAPLLFQPRPKRGRELSL